MSQTACQGIHWGPTKENAVYKGNLDAWEKYSVKLAITLDPEDVEDAQHVRSDTNNKKINIEMPFNRLIIEFLKAEILKSCSTNVFASHDTSMKT